jgi:lipopolysaccharide export system protein LptC
MPRCSRAIWSHSTVLSEPVVALDGPAGGLGPAPPAPAARIVRTVWWRAALDAVSAYLPLLLMALLALGTWWLVENTPLFVDRPEKAPLRHQPDYTMTRFLVQRFAADGVMRAQIEGDLMRHYPDTETIEIDNPRIRSIGAADGRVTLATARTALSNRDGSEVQLSGAAHITRAATAKDAAIEFRSDFLHYFQATEQVRSHLPVVVTQGATEIQADSMLYDNLARSVDLKGRIRAVLPQRSTRASK